MDTKQCTKCGECKSAESFFKNARYKDGLMSWCKACLAANTKAWRDSNKDRASAHDKEYRLANKERIAAKKREWRQANAEAEAARDLKRRRANPERNRIRAARWAAQNREAVNSKSAARRARSKQAQPDWLTDGELDLILLRYKEARVLSSMSGIVYEVDHIVPINGDAVCGLHVPWNLRVIPKRENRRKSKKLIEALAFNITMM
jgi:hypothetical protein